MRWVAAMSGERVSGGDSGDSGRRRDLKGRRGVLEDKRFLFLAYALPACVFVTGALPLVFGWFGLMTDSSVIRFAVFVQGLAGAVVAVNVGIAGIALLRQEERHSEMRYERRFTWGDSGGGGGQIVEEEEGD